MLKEIFEAARDFFEQHREQTPTRIEFLDEKRTRFYWNPETKRVESKVCSRPDAKHKLLTIASVIDYVEGRNHSTTIWVGKKAITVELIENEPGDILTLDLSTTTLFQRLESLVVRPSITQADAIRLLRQQLSPSDPGSRALTAARSMKLSRSTETESEQTHVTDRIGKSIRQVASGAGELPEYLDVPVTVYEASQQQNLCTVRVWLSVDFKNEGCFLFEPDADQMEQATKAEREAMIEQLRMLPAEYVSIYEGVYCVS
jgi:hypothetical protein